MAKYTVSMSLDCRVDVDVEADSFDEAFKKVKSETYDWFNVEVVGGKPVNATDENGNIKDYNG